MRKLTIALVTMIFLLHTGMRQAQAVPITEYENFIDNLQTTPGRGFAIGNEIEVTGNLSSLPLYILVAIRILTLYTNADPQYALLFNELEVNGSSVFDQLVAEALLPSNQITSAYIPNLLGGATFTATSAFSGSVLNSAGVAIPELQVGFGVFQDGLGQNYFTPIIFADTLGPLLNANGLELNLAPVVPESTTGSFRGTARELLARSVPEPNILWLSLIGGVLLMISRTRVFTRSLECNRSTCSFQTRVQTRGQF
jgi:hypothetical protein